MEIEKLKVSHGTKRAMSQCLALAKKGLFSLVIKSPIGRGYRPVALQRPSAPWAARRGDADSDSDSGAADSTRTAHGLKSAAG